jgi:translation initiation factor IF-1
MTAAGADGVEVAGVVIEQLPKALYRVEVEGRREVLAHVSGDVRRNFLRIMTGDRVLVRLSRNDRSRGRITRRC